MRLPYSLKKRFVADFPVAYEILKSGLPSYFKKAPRPEPCSTLISSLQACSGEGGKCSAPRWKLTPLWATGIQWWQLRGFLPVVYVIVGYHRTRRPMPRVLGGWVFSCK